MIVGSLLVEMAANVAKLQQDMEQAKQVVGSAMDGIKASAEIAGKAIAALGVATTAAGLVAMVQSTIEATAELYKMSQRTGVAVESLSSLKSAAKITGTDMGDVATGLQKLSRAMVEAQSGTGKASDTFQKLGVSLKDGNGHLKTADQMMLDVAKALQGFETGAGTTAAMMNILGKAGANLGPMLQELAEKGLSNAKVTAEQAKQAEEFVKAQAKFQAQVQGVIRSLALELLPVLEKLPGLFKVALEAGAAFFGAFVVVPALMTAGITAFTAFAVAVYEGETAMSVGAALLQRQFLAFGPTFAGLTAQVGVLGAGIVAALGVVAAAFAGWELGKWLRENFLEAQLAGIAFVRAMLDGWENVKYSAQVAWAAIQSAWDSAVQGMGGSLSGFLELLAGGLSKLGLTDAAIKMQQWAGSVANATGPTQTFAERMKELNAQHAAAKQGIESITDDMADEAIATFKSAEAHKERKKQLDLGKPHFDSEPYKKLLEKQLKDQELAIQAEGKQLAAREKQLDYYQQQGYISLKFAEETKQALVMESAVKVQAAYDKEAEAIRKYLAVGQALAGNGDQTLAKKGQAMVADAQKMLAEVTAKQAQATIDANGKVVESVQKVGAVQNEFDRATTERVRQYDMQNRAAQLQVDLLGQSTLAVQQQTAAQRVQFELEDRIEALKRAGKEGDIAGAKTAAAAQIARQNDLIAQSYYKQRDGIFGANEALRKYSEDATNLGAHMENAVTNAFRGMEDALVSFVKTGKLDFKSLADSIIADLIRIQVQQSITGPLAVAMKNGQGFAGALGSLFGGGGVKAPGVNQYSFVNEHGIADSGLAFAGGGRPPVGMASMVGERGPELFVPDSAGTIVPNVGGTTIKINQNVHIDGEADRATVYSNVSRAMDENNRQLMGHLKSVGLLQ